MDVLAGGINGQGVGGKLFAQHHGKPVAQRIKQIAGFRVGAEGDTPAAPAGHVPQGKAHGRFCHGQPFDHVEDRLSLGPLGAQELQARGRGINRSRKVTVVLGPRAAGRGAWCCPLRREFQ